MKLHLLKLVKEIFEMARKKTPAIVFIDELDALAAKRMEVGTSGEREVNRTFMQLLAELDGFDPLDNVKVIGATNRKDILDPAIIRPGRLDRLIKVDVPGKEAKLEIFKIHSRDMTLELLEEIISDIMINDGPDGHCDGHEIIAEFVFNLQESEEFAIVWLKNYTKSRGLDYDYKDLITNNKHIMKGFTLSELKELQVKVDILDTFLKSEGKNYINEIQLHLLTLLTMRNKHDKRF